MNGPIPEELKARARELWGDGRKGVDAEGLKTLRAIREAQNLEFAELIGEDPECIKNDVLSEFDTNEFRKAAAILAQNKKDCMAFAVESNLPDGKFSIGDLKAGLVWESKANGITDRPNAVFSDEALKNIKIDSPQTGLRMYFFVMYNLSGIQKGIQAGHAALEYARSYRDDPQFKDFTENHKTFILLDGGGSNDMLVREKELNAFGIKYASFNEPDLNGSMSAIAFVMPESVYGFKEEEFIKYGLYIANGLALVMGEGKEAIIRKANDDFETHKEYKWLKSFRLAAN